MVLRAWAVAAALIVTALLLVVAAFLARRTMQVPFLAGSLSPL